MNSTTQPTYYIVIEHLNCDLLYLTRFEAKAKTNSLTHTIKLSINPENVMLFSNPPKETLTIIQAICPKHIASIAINRP